MRESPTLEHLRGARFFKWALSLALLIGLVMALIGPFGTYTDLSLIERLIYWEVITCLNTLQIALGVKLCRFYWGKRFSVFWTRVQACLLASIPAFVEIIMLEAIFRDMLPLDFSLLEIYFYVATATVVIGVAVDWTALRQTRGKIKPETDSTVRFHQRIPRKIQGELLALSAEDHYLRIYTDQGSELILMRLSDAVNELQNEDGMRVHRSHWVARLAVAAAKRDKGRVLLRLKNEVEIPISRSYMKQVRAAGWLD